MDWLIRIIIKILIVCLYKWCKKEEIFNWCEFFILVNNLNLSEVISLYLDDLNILILSELGF